MIVKNWIDLTKLKEEIYKVNSHNLGSLSYQTVNIEETSGFSIS